MNFYPDKHVPRAQADSVNRILDVADFGGYICGVEYWRLRKPLGGHEPDSTLSRARLDMLLAAPKYGVMPIEAGGFGGFDRVEKPSRTAIRLRDDLIAESRAEGRTMRPWRVNFHE